MEIDIILTAFNNPSYLVECVKSLQSQTFKNFRVIVIDDCSHEPMLPHIYGIVNKDARFELNENKSNLGGPINFLTRARDSKAKYIMWLHHDDWLHPDFLQKAYAGLEQNTEAAFAYCLCARVIDGVVKNEFPTSIRPDLQTGIHDISYDAVINCWIMWSCALIRNSSYKECGGLEYLYNRHFNRNIGSVYRKGESDLYIFAKLSCKNKVFVLNERLCYYRDHNDSNTNNSKLVATRISDNVRTYDYIFDEIEYFTDEIRIMAKINSIGRLSMKMSLAEAAYRILFMSMLGREYISIRMKMVRNLRTVMSRFILDNESMGWPRVFKSEEINFMDRILKVGDV